MAFDRTEMHCNIENLNKPTSWRRVDGQPLPQGSQLYGGVLVIDVTAHDAAGYYECTVRENDVEIPVVRTEIVVIGKVPHGMCPSESVNHFTSFVPKNFLELLSYHQCQ